MRSRGVPDLVSEDVPLAATVVTRKCKCGEKYKTKQKKLKDTKLCPGCGKDNTPPR